MAHPSTYEATLRQLYQRAQSGFKFGLDTMRALLDALGAPQQRFDSVLVAGTNGKGSTSTLLANALRLQGQRVGLYTSPHLLRFTERIRIDGAELAAATVPNLFAQVLQAAAARRLNPSFFECTTLMALLAFADGAIETAVLEVGLGGRLDATNAVPRKLAIITPIALDHQEYLGDTLPRIAAEKADIIAADAPVVVAPQVPEVMDVIVQVAQDRRAPLHVVPPDAIHAAPGLPPYQGINVACARTAAALLGCTPQAIDAAEADFVWPGRYQWLLADSVVIDGAHNPAGIAALLAALHADSRAASRRLHVVFSALQSKNAATMLTMLERAATTLHLCPVNSQRSRSMAQLRALAPQHRIHRDVGTAIAAAQAAAAGDLVVITGSLFLAADALALLLNLPRDPPIDG